MMNFTAYIKILLLKIYKANHNANENGSTNTYTCQLSRSCFNILILFHLLHYYVL